MRQTKLHFVLVTFLILIGCVRNSEETIPAFKYKPRTYCQNELMLLVDPLNNWQIPIDSIISFKDYFNRSLEQRRKHPSDFEHSMNILFDSIKNIINIDSARAFYNKIHPLVFPYINVDSINVSFAQLMRVNGFGYTGDGTDVLPLYFSKNYFKNRSEERIRVYDFYINYNQKDKQSFSKDKQYSPFELLIFEKIESSVERMVGPRIYLIVEDNMFCHLRIVLKDIITEYLEAISTISMKKFQKQICDLNEMEISLIKKDYPLKIRLKKP